jgi:spore coat polysaccharide biosynthesis predicted glycosyltransferase SpsG
MVDLMHWADIAITAGGSTCYELACTGLPGIIITLFDNQQHIAAGLHAKGIAIALGWHADISKGQLIETVAKLLRAPDQRKAMSYRGMERIDGRGSERVFREMVGRLQD